MNAPRRVAVVIPTVNRPFSLGECLRSLAGSLTPVTRVLVADASADLEAIRRAVLPPKGNWPFEFELLTSPVCGAAAQRNHALSALKDEDGVLFIDDDAVVEPDCIGEMLEAFSSRESNVAGVAANISNQPVDPPGFATRSMLWLMGGGWHHDYSGRLIGPAVGLLPCQHIKERFVPIEWAHGGCVMYRREAIPTGGFRAHFCGYSLGEDVALSMEAQRIGPGILLYASRALAIHTPGVSTHPPPFECGKMHVLNRWYLTREILRRSAPLDRLRFWLWLAWEFVASLSAVLRGGNGWKSWRANWRGRWVACREILFMNRNREQMV